MAAMTGLQSSMTALSLSSNSFMGQRLSVPLSRSSFSCQAKRESMSHCCEDCVLIVVFEIEAPIHSSNPMLDSKEQDDTSQVGNKVLDNGEKVRNLVKTGEIIDSGEIWKKLKVAVKEKTEVTAAVS